MMKSYKYESGVFTIEGAISVENNEKYCAPWRIDINRRKLFPFLDTFGQGDACTGVRIAFTTDSRNVGIDIYETYRGEDGIHDIMMLDIVVNGMYVETIELDKGEGLYDFGLLDAGVKDVEIWLDPKYPVRFKSIHIDDEAMIEKTESTKKRLVIYGSSIVHSVRARSPYYTWPAIVAAKKDMHLTNLGFGGNCILDPIMGMIMRDMDADIFCLELGSNCYSGNLTDRSFAPCAIGLVKTIRQKHIETPIVILSQKYIPAHEVEKGGCRMNAQEMREELKNVVAVFRQYGDKNIYYADGLEIFGPENIKYMEDKVHPNAEGQFVFAENFNKRIMDKLDF